MTLRPLAMLLTIVSAPALACGGGGPCSVPPSATHSGGEYRARPPQGWDGRRPLPALVFIHGHRSGAAEMMAYGDLAATADALGFLLIAPQGLDGSWSTPGSPSDGRRDEIAFVGAALDAAADRYPIDRDRVVASGFSQGASVVWEIACRGDGRFQAFVPVAGVWWRPMPTECPAPPRPVLHIHGTEDPVMPMAGRNLRDRWRQGDVMQAMATLRRINGCSVSAERTEQRGVLACTFDEGCTSGKSVALCLHPGDHHIDPRWLIAIRDWIERVLPAR
jgi:polyhydroxybutyrate depolymerase